MKKIFFSLLLISSALILSNCGNSTKETPTKEDGNVEENIKIATETIAINGVNHFISKMGEGEPLLVLHGGPGLFHNYLVPHFKNLAKEYQIIFYDQRGCGNTDFPTDTSSINLQTYIEDLEAIRTHLKIEKLNLVGHSWGSLLAINYAKKYNTNIKRLVLISPAPGNSNYFDATFSNMQKKRTEEDTKNLVQTMMSPEFEKRNEESFKKAILLGDKVNLVNQEKITELYKPMTFDKDKADNLMLVNSLLEKTYFNLNIIEGLESVTIPSLIIVGDLDNVPFASTQLIHENLNNSKLEVIKKSCHYPFFESPKEFNKIMKNFFHPEYES
ncbi:alpha/beta fold hydrolase [Vicingaceae bacterium]|nr:alpha/beta fold hydrolase [Vicingaceae bacterium]